MVGRLASIMGGVGLTWSTEMPETIMTNNLSIYASPEGQAKCMAIYEAALANWPVPFEQFDLPTRFGSTHIIASGPKDGQPLILLHGQWATATMWSSTIAKLSRDHRVYALDQIDDVGKSVPTHIPASRLDYAAWLVDVFDQLGLQQADIIGLSYGGFLAMNFALGHPERVKRLILLCPGIPSFGPPTLRWAIHGMPMTLFPSNLTAKWLVRGLSIRGYQPDDLEVQQLVAGAQHIRTRIPFRPAFSDSEFGKLKTPVLLLIGEREAMYDARPAVDRARQLIPNIEAEIIPNAGHMLSTDQPEAVISRVMQFLDGTDCV
jgi:pimeloyl-ACP methyl ester carboxylesterase